MPFGASPDLGGQHPQQLQEMIPVVNSLPQRNSNPQPYQMEGKRIIMEKGAN